jgi:hypothetical protein
MNYLFLFIRGRQTLPLQIIMLLCVLFASCDREDQEEMFVYDLTLTGMASSVGARHVSPLPVDLHFTGGQTPPLQKMGIELAKMLDENGENLASMLSELFGWQSYDVTITGSVQEVAISRHVTYSIFQLGVVDWEVIEGQAISY